MDLHAETDANSWLASYNSYLRVIVGTTATTRVRYSHVVRRFVVTCFERHIGWPRLSGQRVMDFVRKETATKLDRAIAKTRLAGQTSLPRHLSAPQIMQLVDAARTGRAPRRDRAILLLLTQLALRCAEIVALELDDIDSTAGLLRICNRKSHRERVLALPREVGTALADYVQHDGPPGLSRATFFGVNNPSSPLRNPTAITCMVKRNMVRADIPLSRLSGAHLLRHTVASRLVNSGATFREVADLLGAMGAPGNKLA